MAQLEPKLKDLLVREAHLRLGRDQLTPVWREKEAELRAVQAARPVFLPVFSKRKRIEYEEQLKAAQETVEVLRKGLDVIDRIEPQVKKLIEEEIRLILREERPEFGQAFIAIQQKEDWVRALDRFAERVLEFTSVLGNVRNLAASGYSRQANTFSKAALQAFEAAAGSAKKIEEEVASANKIADAQARTLIANGFNVRPLPRLEATDYPAWVTRISALSLAEAQTQFDQLIEKTKKLHETGIPELRGHAQGVEHRQMAEVNSSLLAVWQKFRVQIAPEIYPGDTEQSVSDSERLLTAKMRNTVLGGM